MNGPVAFDYGATLRLSDGCQGVRDLVGRLNAAGVSCIVISAIAEAYDERKIAAEIEELIDSEGNRLKFDAVFFTRYPPDPTEADAIETGKKKAQVMKENGATLLFDDSFHVCQVVNSIPGLSAVRVSADLGGR